jgi:hypothetical protein
MDLVKHYPATDPRDPRVGTLDDVSRCARPILFETEDERFKYAGNGSSFVAVRDETWMLFTASHVIGTADPHSVRVLPTDTARRWLRFNRRARVTSLLEGDPDLADVACLTIDVADLKTPDCETLAGIDLRCPTATPKVDNQLWIGGYPGISRGVGYDARVITAIGFGIGARYVGPSIGARCHEIELTEIGALTDFDGFSGSPVFWIGDQDGDLVTLRLAGMVLRGTAAFRRAHYVDVSVLLAAAETAATGAQTHLVRRDQGSLP